MKQGYKTTEFWASMASTVMGMLVSSGMLSEAPADHWAVPVFGVIASFGPAIVYTAARTWIKGKEANGNRS